MCVSMCKAFFFFSCCVKALCVSFQNVNNYVHSDPPPFIYVPCRFLFLSRGVCFLFFILGQHTPLDQSPNIFLIPNAPFFLLYFKYNYFSSFQPITCFLLLILWHCQILLMDHICCLFIHVTIDINNTTTNNILILTIRYLIQ